MPFLHSMEVWSVIRGLQSIRLPKVTIKSLIICFQHLFNKELDMFFGNSYPDVLFNIMTSDILWGKYMLS